mmetsp:Transcript_15923/g.26677  ORF Transcript_15923/g.26677 Transcript_15923/m.26677 type:complete len:488 (-) Transcript_15923:306-1769(-)
MAAFEIANEYELGKVLSHETHSHTHVATLKGQEDGKIFRARRIFGAAADRQKADRASKIVEQLSGLSHNGLLPVTGSFVVSNEDSGDRDFCVVSENAKGESLAHKMGELSFKSEDSNSVPTLELPSVMNLFFDTLQALEYLHDNNIPHMDIRPESIFIQEESDSEKFVLINYGLADIVTVNSMEFIPPEVHKRESLLRNAQFNVDVWAFGAVLLDVVCGALIVSRVKDSWQDDLATLLTTYDSRGVDKTATDTATDSEPVKWSLQSVLDAHFKEHPAAEELWNRIPSELATIISMCLSVDPASRPTVTELLATPEYTTLLSARILASTEPSDDRKSSMNVEERSMLRKHIDDLTMRLATREERMVCLETLLATERDAHYRTATLLEEANEKLEEALTKIANMEVAEEIEHEQSRQCIGLHHPGFYNGELNEYNCCTRKGRLTTGCQEGIIKHHPGYYDHYGGGIWGCCKGGWNSAGCTMGAQPKWER